ncbi:hypothetical protein [Dermabacter jinjuensis]|uniref:DUF4386 family protein n=1 Tax=Dermabacter jinjuensis TaxID=1667168 RepID=A0ABM6PM57_9MICO|nr:hypothetical protein [Dermabacter jinjuensis]ATH95916.1 hypothetical protein COP05_01515 [Dermabacter jinjuensis]UEB89979.1 hypothetical protein LK448_00250 [Dermabacter jinjuensis]
MIAPVNAYTGDTHRAPARVWVLMTSIAVALLVLAPGVALALLAFPIFIEDPPNTMPAFRGVNTLTYTVFRSVLVCVVAALTANVLVFAATPAIVRALKRCPSKGAARFGAIAALLFLAGALVSAAIWALVLAPVVVAFSPDPESLRDQLPRFNLLLIFVPFVIDSVRFLVMPLAGIAVAGARQRGAAPPVEPTMAPVPR